MKQALQLRLGQQLTMTPQMQQAIRLLQMSAVELKQEIQTALESNLMLELLEDDGLQVDAETDGGIEDPPPVETDLEGSGPDEREHEDATGVDWEPPGPGWSSEPGGGGTGETYESQAAAPQGLHEYLHWQLELTPFTATDVAIAETIIDYIDDDGYLKVSLEEIQSALPGSCSAGLDEVEAVLHRIQHFDPLGVGARNPAECLAVQLGQFPDDTPALATARAVVAGHLEAIASGQIARVAAALGVDAGELDAALALLRTLSPRPGAQVASADPEFVIPDVLVSRRDGRWVVELNPELLPRLRINPYYAELAQTRSNEEDRACMRSHLQEARWLLKSLQSRAETLLRVAGFIVGHQSEYLEHGDTAMRPLVLREVAEALEMHESTISRVTSNKYLHTPRGVVEFRHFFSSQLGTTDGGGTSATAVRAQIRRLIAAEEATHPLSDGRIAELLADMGLKVARRTVAKYREGMSILPATERRRAG